MKKLVWTLTIIAVITGSLTLTAPFAFAQDFDGPVPEGIPGELVYIPFPVNIDLDGDLSDWEGLPSYFVDYGQMTSPDPEENGSFTFSVAADSENFYITMQMPDKNIIAGKHGENYYDEDSMEFYINASGDLGASSYDLKIFQINIPAADIGNTDPTDLSITGVFSTDVTVRGYVFETEDGWGFEAEVPLHDYLLPGHGTEIGFQAQINGATKMNRDVKLIWSNADKTDSSWQNPALFGRGIFFELGRTDIPEPSKIQLPPTPVPTPMPEPIPAQVSINQTGYFPLGKKIATLATNKTTEQDWALVGSSGEILMSGKTIVFGEDKMSGEFLHEIDFSAFDIPGAGYRIISGELESAKFEISENLYSQLKLDALAYFYHNRSGIPIEANLVGDDWARPAGHLSDDWLTCFKGEDAAGKHWDGCEYFLDVDGGWYDAGDFGKYVVNGGISAWTLMNLYERFSFTFTDNTMKIPEAGNGVPDLLDEARWEMEFILSMQVPEGQPRAGMAHHKLHDIEWEPLPMVPPTDVDNDSSHEYPTVGRYLYPPSTAATLNLAATAAQCARIWEEIDQEFSDQCLAAAEKAWLAAREFPGIYAGNTPGTGGGNYDDENVIDEFYWAASELFATTDNDEYLEYLLDSVKFGYVDSFDWGHTASLGTISLLVSENTLPTEQGSILEKNLLAFADEMKKAQEGNGYGILIDGDFPWGSNGLIMNNSILMGLAYDISGDPVYLDALRLSMDYILGHNPNNISYVSGYGAYAMEHPHHRFWANLPAEGYPPPPPGALSGGPNAGPTDEAALNNGLMDLAPTKRYIDHVDSYSTNEITINWNAPLAWTATFLDEYGAEGQKEEVGENDVVMDMPTRTQNWIYMGVGFVLMVAPFVWWFVRNGSQQKKSK